MGPSFTRVNVVNEAKHNFAKGIVILKSRLNDNVIPFAGNVDRILMQNGFVLVQVRHKMANSAIKFVYYLFRYR